MAIYFGGSRSLPSSPLLSQVVGSVLQSSQVVHVGCSTGADQQVIECALRSSSFSQMRVFAAFEQSGIGSCVVSAVKVVQQFAAAGGSVSWLAGGPLSVPLAARLILRSVAALSGCSAAVFFQPGAGSLAVASRAISAGVPVFAFSQSAPATPAGCVGSWLPPSVSCGFWGWACWHWLPTQAPLF